jgi:S-DNA-T family DNA segregation ATPase FtsK/SpoIIIE
MAVKRKRRSRTNQRAKNGANSQHSRLANSLTGVLVILLTLTGWFNLGLIGKLVNGLYQFLVGQSELVLMLIVCLYAISLIVYNRLARFRTRWVVGFLIFYAGLLILLHAQMFDSLNQHTHFMTITINHLEQSFMNDNAVPIGGGLLGGLLFTLSVTLLSIKGAPALAWLLMIVGTIIFFDVPWQQILAHGGQTIVKGWHLVRQKMNNRPQHGVKKEPVINSPMADTNNTASSQQPAAVSPSQTKLPISSAEPTITVASSPEKTAAAAVKSDSQEGDAVAAEKNTDTDQDFTIDANDQSDADYQLPPVSLLTKVGSTDQSGDLQSIKSNTKKLQSTLKSFGVDATVENVNLGPSVTKYELRPAVGVKVSRITHLADDLALALAAKDIRIEAPIPGKSLIGIEVPNKKIATVGFRDMIEAVPPHHDKPLEVALGRTVTGEVMTADLTKMPHLLIAGATGSGKSVAINVIITSILLNAKPHQVKFLMIDPKKVELSVYNGIPHLLSPVVSDPKKAARALGKVVAEMERRYELFAHFGIRNIKGYNAQVKAHPEDENHHYLPLILVIVDELSDLMMTVSKDVEDAIVRIAQMGRAAGIHMILATQRPSVDVITGLIKANVPSRIAFAVSSGVDSRTILGTNGAEKLLGRGDMLFQPIDQNKPTRVQGAFISDHDVEAVVDFIKKEQPAHYDEKMVVSDAEIKQVENQEEQDSLFPEAVKFVVQEQKASTSLIQRRFRIGYNRAARIIDDMEQQGYIGPANGSKPREVYKNPPSQQQ